jgi:ribitol 2-dehydrogenase
MDHPLAGKVVIITGASSGIGEATARALAPLGCKLTLAARSVDRLEALAGELVADTLVLPGDITNGDYVISMVESTLERFGRLDVLFANAGIYIPGEAAEGNPDDWAQLMDVNINGVLRSTHAALGPMIKQGSGDILVTSSISGFIDIHWEPIYSASKHAIQAFVHTLRRQVAPHGIRVGAIAPGRTVNALWGFTEQAAIDAEIEKQAGLRSEDVANAVVFMLSQPPHVNIRDLVMLPLKQEL